jgi:signal transduction histidine kinase
MRLLPDSLFSRLLLALLGVIGLTIIIAGMLIVNERRELAFWAGEASGFVAVIAETSASLAELPEADRGAAIEALREEPPSIEVEFQRRPEQSPERVRAVLAAYRRALERRLGPDYTVAVALADREASDAHIPIVRERPGQRGPDRFERRGRREPRQVAVRIGLPDGADLGFLAPLPRPGQAPPGSIFPQLAVLTLMLGIVLFFMTRTITRPLSRLAEAAETVGRGGRTAPLPEVGAREVREATRAFNAMQERLHRYLDSRTRVLAAMSHDLRTPLTRIRLRVESIEDESVRERFITDVDEMNRMISGALGLFRGLNEDEAESPCDVSDLLEDLRGEFAEMGVTVTIEGEALRPMRIKPLAIKRCLTNLLSNAAKFAGHPKIVVDDGVALVIHVCDDGPGIPEADLERVFEPFYRVESSRNVETGGTGLGLSIARDIAQAHGGSLVLRNRSPHGLEAILTLPRTATV